MRMLTDKGDVVLDPFAGSCVTGEVAEALGRTWIACEQEREYLLGALGRFQVAPRLASLSKPYSVYPPATLATDDEGELLPTNGGAERAPRASAAQENMPERIPSKVTTKGVRAVLLGV